MEPGTSGVNGPSATTSARGSEAENATPQHPDTVARCAKGVVGTRRTAQMGSVPRVRPLSTLGIIIYHQHFTVIHMTIYSIYTHISMANHHKHV